jgi:hypothetical protein
LKLGKQKAEIARRRARRSAAISCPGGAWKAMASNAAKDWIKAGAGSLPRWRRSCP